MLSCDTEREAEKCIVVLKEYQPYMRRPGCHSSSKYMKRLQGQFCNVRLASEKPDPLNE